MIQAALETGLIETSMSADAKAISCKINHITCLTVNADGFTVEKLTDKLAKAMDNMYANPIIYHKAYRNYERLLENALPARLTITYSNGEQEQPQYFANLNEAWQHLQTLAMEQANLASQEHRECPITMSVYPKTRKIELLHTYNDQIAVYQLTAVSEQE